MIGSLRGTILERDPTGELLVEVAGVGYRVVVTPQTSVDLGQPDNDVFLWIHHHRREDAEVLFGFGRRDDRTVFAALLGAHGVGPSLALAILSVHSPAELASILLSDDVAALCLVPGVGKKTAARLLIELKDALDTPDIDLTAPAVPPGGNGASAPGSAVAEVREALAGLGYGADEIRQVLRELPSDRDSSLLLRDALQRLASW